MEIVSVKALQILDSRGLPTVSVWLDCGDLGTFNACVPSGASTGSREAVELRDGDKNVYHGKGVQKAVKNTYELGSMLIKEGKDKKISVTEQFKLDDLMEKADGTENKSVMGANAILALSMAICRAGAAKKGVPLYKHINDLVLPVTKDAKMSLPAPFFNVLNGGKHADNTLACQEIMVTTKADTMADSIRMGSEIFHSLKSSLKKQGLSTNVGDEGGFAPSTDVQGGIDLIHNSAKEIGCGDKIGIGFDFAASEFYEDGKYNFDFKRDPSQQKAENNLTGDQVVDYMVKLVEKNPIIISIEDPASEHDPESFAKIVKQIDTKKTQIVADDLTVTNASIIKKSVANKESNSLLVKLNQNGSVSGTIRACHEAFVGGWSLMVSHRSGETCDDFVADLAVGLGARSVKFGAPSRGERCTKYNRLMEIESRDKDLKMHPQKF